MKIVATGNSYRAVNFGRSLNSSEMQNAYNVALDARKSMGFQDGNGVLVLPGEKLPKQTDVDLKEVLNSFFDKVKKLLGINAVEVVGDIDETSKKAVEESLKENNLKRFVRFEVPSNPDELESAVRQVAKDADGIRVMANNESVTKEQLVTIENAFKAVKGNEFNPYMIVCEHNGRAYDWGNPNKIKDLFKNKVIVGSSNCLNDINGLWGSKSFFTDRMGVAQGSFIHGLRSTFDTDNFNAQISSNKQINEANNLLEKELKLQDDDLFNPKRFAAAKRADVVLSKHFYKHFDDIFPGITTDIVGFEKAYNEALQNGLGDNYFDSLAKAMKSLGLDKTSPEIYESVCKYRNALYAKGAKTLEELANVSLQDIEASYKDTSNVVLQGVEVKKAAVEAAKLEAEKKAKELEKNAEKLKNFLKMQESIASEAPVLRNKINPTELSRFDKFINFVRFNKIKFALAGVFILLATIGGTMYSYGKEVAKKSQAAKPKPDNIFK